MCDIQMKNCTTVQQTNVVTVPYQAKRILLKLEDHTWRFLVSSDELVKLEWVQTDILGNEYIKTEWIAPKGQTEIQGRGQVDIYATNYSLSSVSATVSIYTAPHVPVLEQIFYDDIEQQSLNGAQIVVGSFNGYPAPFCNYMRVFGSQNLRVLGMNMLTGNYTYLSGPQNVDEVTFKDLYCPKFMRFEIRQDTASAVTPLYFQVTWFRNLT